jgi:hypothetical protein
MTLWVLGWVEVNHELPEERLGDVSTWQPLLSLDPFDLADQVSDYLFGIANRASASGRCDCAGCRRRELVRRSVTVSL